MPLIENPYRPLSGGTWLKGNLHAHTTRSDGKLDPQTVIDRYAACGHDFLMISDHDVYTGPAEYAAFDSRGMTLLPGNEISRGGPHLLHVGAGERVEPVQRRQLVLNAVATSGAGFAIAAHPNWKSNFDYIPVSQLREWVGYAGIEIYNGVVGRSHGSSYALDKWDMILGSGIRAWGFANDDSHHADEIGRGWNVVHSQSREPEAILEGLAAGRFYASTGVVIHSIAVEGSIIRIETENAAKIVARSKIDDRLKRIAESNASCIELEVPDEATGYVRFECWGSGEAFAWTQPFYLS